MQCPAGTAGSTQAKHFGGINCQWDASNYCSDGNEVHEFRNFVGDCDECVSDTDRERSRSGKKGLPELTGASSEEPWHKCQIWKATSRDEAKEQFETFYIAVACLVLVIEMCGGCHIISIADQGNLGCQHFYLVGVAGIRSFDMMSATQMPAAAPPSPPVLPLS